MERSEMHAYVVSRLQDANISFAKIEVATGITVRALYIIKKGENNPHESTLKVLNRFFKRNSK